MFFICLPTYLIIIGAIFLPMLSICLLLLCSGLFGPQSSSSKSFQPRRQSSLLSEKIKFIYLVIYRQFLSTTGAAAKGFVFIQYKQPSPFALKEGVCFPSSTLALSSTQQMEAAIYISPLSRLPAEASDGRIDTTSGF